mmetsp:Transcript_11167/g.19555  ORF Transcript_11167/g.19555 Transcript_11167/m.19555 type:complete len:228 (-) Transcript_11167:1774-2457(-)
MKSCREMKPWPAGSRERKSMGSGGLWLPATSLIRVNARTRPLHVVCNGRWVPEGLTRCCRSPKDMVQSACAALWHSSMRDDPPMAPQRARTPTNSLQRNCPSGSVCTCASCKMLSRCPMPTTSSSSRKCSMTSRGSKDSTGTADSAFHAVDGSRVLNLPTPAGEQMRPKTTESTQARIAPSALATCADIPWPPVLPSSDLRFASAASAAICSAYLRQTDQTGLGKDG